MSQWKAGDPEMGGVVSRVALGPNDVIVLTCDKHIPEMTAKRMGEIVQEKFPGHDVLVLGGGIKLGLVGRG